MRRDPCSGLSQAAYFNTIQKVFAGITIPDDCHTPMRQITASSNTIKEKFAAANPGLDQQSTRLLCDGRFLSEIRLCLTKDLKPRPCSADVQDTCRSGSIILRPVR